MKSLSLSSAMVLVGAAVALTTSGFASEPTTWYVDDAKYGASGNGKGLESAFGTIQEAVDAAVAGDTVLVAEGTYSRGAKKATAYTDNTSSRVVIDKAITVKSISGKGRTFIVGEGDYVNEPTYGLGANAVRCVAITAQNAVLEGFTLTCGRVYDDGTKNFTTAGGGVCVQSGSESDRLNAYIVDCAISGCFATRGGGSSGGSLVRCLLTGNRADKVSSGAGVSGQAGYCGSYYNCVFADNGVRGSTTSQTLGYVSDVVNCTFVGNSSFHDVVNIMSGGNGNVKNSITMLNPGGGRFDSGLTTECNIVNPTDKIILASPIKGDWRPLSGKAAVGAGSVAALDLIPAAYRDKDFLGNPRKTGGSVSIGAVEASVAPAGGIITFTERGGTLDGCPIYAKNLYHHAVEWPEQVHLEPAEAEPGKAFFGWVTTESGLTDTYTLFPERDGGRWVTMPSSGTTLSAAPTYGTLLLVDAASTAETPDGLTVATAYPTIQSAIDSRASGSYSVVRVRRGMYRTGATSDDAWGRSRVYIRYKHVLLWAESGPEDTFIIGEAATDAEETYGVGADAVRCLCFRSYENHICASGFTLVDGHTQIGADGNDIKGQGGAVRGYNDSDTFRHQIVDCVISNNVAYRAPGGFKVWMQRCLVTGNRDQSHVNAIFREGVISSCVFRDNMDAGHPSVGQNVNAYGCTFKGVSGKSNIYPAGPCLAANCLFIGGNNLAATGATVATAGNFGDTDGSQLTEGFAYGAAKVARARANDFRPRVGSPLVGGGDTSIAGWARFAVSDFDGNPMTFTGGRPTIGAYQTAIVPKMMGFAIVFR